MDEKKPMNGKTKIDAAFLEECMKELEQAEKSGRLRTLMTQSVLSTRVDRPKKPPEN